MVPYGKRPDTVVHQHDPFNAEPPREALARSPLTAVEGFYVRNHGPVPALGADAVLEIGGMVDAQLTLTLGDLRHPSLPEVEVCATLQCAGNRRASLSAVRPIHGEAPWGPGATGTASWRGVRLADVLAMARPRPAAAHVAFVGADLCGETEPPEPFAASIELEKALRPEVLLAWEMNGEPLQRIHGGPLRVVVPGYIGARSVKWVRRIDVREAPWDGHWQAVAYRLLAPDEEPAAGVGMALTEVALNADILEPADGATVRAGPLAVRGYAFAGGERAIGRVDVSADGGESWRQAELLEDLGRWAWRRWRLEVQLEAGEHELIVRAWDTAAATQPEHPGTVWNPKGYANNAWGRVRVVAG